MKIMRKYLWLMILMALPITSHSSQFEFRWPGQNLEAIYLYDFIGSQNLAGFESPFLSYKRDIYLSVGFAIKIEPGIEKEIPFIGVNHEFEDRFSIGLFLGKDFELGEEIAGFKANFELW